MEHTQLSDTASFIWRQESMRVLSQRTHGWVWVFHWSILKYKIWFFRYLILDLYNLHVNILIIGNVLIFDRPNWELIWLSLILTWKCIKSFKKIIANIHTKKHMSSGLSHFRLQTRYAVQLIIRRPPALHTDRRRLYSAYKIDDIWGNSAWEIRDKRCWIRWQQQPRRSKHLWNGNIDWYDWRKLNVVFAQFR